MSRLCETLRLARMSAALDMDTMSRLVGVTQERLGEIEKGCLPTPEEIDSYALAFGLTAEELAGGDASRSPVMRLLFRATEDQRRSVLEALTDTNAHRVFGDFVRAVGELARLEGIVGRSPSGEVPPPPKTDLVETPPYGADELARWLRRKLDLQMEPIDSMHGVLDRLGVPVFFVTPEELDAAIDGASTSLPRTAVLVNLVEGPGCWWRTRMTLAHELCHLLVDHRDPNQPPATISPYAVASGHVGPRPRKRFQFYDEFDLVERRAGAFAACFLAPAEAVMHCVGRRDPTSEESISLVGKTFGIGRATACYRLKHVYRLGDATHRAMIAQRSAQWNDATGRDDRGPDDAGLRTGVLRDRALTALAAGQITRTRCYEYLGLRHTDWLPEHAGLTKEQRHPLRSVEDAIRGIAQQHLQSEVAADLVATGVTAGAPDGWHVDVVREPHYAPAGSLVITYDRKPDRYLPAVSSSPRG